MSVAEQTREAVREHPFLYDALGAGVLNYTSAARFLDVGDEDAVAAALRRYATELDPPAPTAGRVRVRMQSGLGKVTDESGLLTVGDATFAPNAGSLTGILATGESVDARRVLGRCETEGIEVEGFGFTNTSLVLVVERRDGATAVRIVEDES